MIEIKNLTKKFKRKIALNNVNLKLENGIYGLLGPNGSGKTTLMRCITKLYSLNNGELIFQNKSYESIGYLPQKFGMFKELTVYEMMSYILYMKNVKKDNHLSEINKTIKLVNMEDRINDRIGSLSGGMIRRLGIAQAILNNPKVLIFDEPTTGLDPEERMRFKNLLSKIKDDKIVIISTHIVEDVESVCNKIIIMNEGNVISIGSTEDIRQFAKNKCYILESNVAEDLKENHFIVKFYEDNEGKKTRILSSKNLSIDSVEPTIEDGYLCYIKGI